MLIKVVRKIEGKYYSVNVKGIFQVEYRPGDWTKTPQYLRELGYGLCVYLEDTDIVKDLFMPFAAGDVELWQVEGRGKIKNLPEISLNALDTDNINIDTFKSWLPNHINRNYEEAWPPNTRMFEEVRLVKKIS